VRADESLVQRLLGDQFPQWAHLPLRPVEPGGWDNTTFRLGDDMLVRLPSAGHYAAQVDKEHRWLPVLAEHLPLPIPEPLAKGAPGSGYPWHWSVYGWLKGDVATTARVPNAERFAGELAGFLAALQRIDPEGGPPPGEHSFFRGGPLVTYDAETRKAIASLGDEARGDAAIAVWESALDATFDGGPVWVHGDVGAENLLVADGRLSAVIDFGCCAVGDPACDLAIAWTFFSGAARDAFRERLRLDDATWARGRGWALWKALITLVPALNVSSRDPAGARQVLDEVLSSAG
jgi:aminoglycoside phosphotransferase (APT) family kinase protein